MALVTAQGVSSLLIPLLRRMLVLPNTVARVPGAEFAGDNGDTITVRVRQPRTANVQAAPGADVSGDFSAISETPVTVALSHLFDGVNVTDEELSLELIDFAAQVTEPQVAAVATGAEDTITAAMDAVAAEANFALTATPDDTKLQIQTAREALSDADVPAGDRFLACAPDIITRLLNVDEFVRADAAGDGPSSAIRDARMGRIYGFTVVESSGLEAGSAVAYHRSGFVFANRAPVPPRGAAESAAVSDSGLALRQIFQYAPHNLRDQSVVSTFAGASLVDAARVFKLNTATA